MSSQNSGSSWLLHTITPNQLVGSIAAWTTPDGSGIVRVSVFKDSTHLRVDEHEDEVWIRVHEQLGLQLAGLLLRVTSQNRELRRRAAHLEPGLFARIQTIEDCLFEYDEGDVEFLGEAKLSKSDHGVRLESAEEQWNVELMENVAESLALCIFDRLGQISAARFWAAEPSCTRTDLEDS